MPYRINYLLGIEILITDPRINNVVIVFTPSGYREMTGDSVITSDSLWSLSIWHKRAESATYSRAVRVVIF